MQGEVLYIKKIPLRLLSLIQVITGAILLSIFIYFLTIEIYLDIWIFAGPLLGLAILLTGLTNSKIKTIYLQTSDSNLVILKESLFKSKKMTIESNKLSVQLKLANGKNSFITKIKLLILDNGKEVEKMESGFLSMNNSKIENLYYDLKSIVETSKGKFV